MNEQGYQPDLIELQLAHAERNQVRAAYNKAQRLRYSTNESAFLRYLLALRRVHIHKLWKEPFWMIARRGNIVAPETRPLLINQIVTFGQKYRRPGFV
jgi:hypothetical protein